MHSYRAKWHNGGAVETAAGSIAPGTVGSVIRGEYLQDDTEWERGTARETAVAVAMMVAERGGALLAALRALCADDLRRAAPLLAAAPALNTLLPHALANLEGLHDSNVITYLY